MLKEPVVFIMFLHEGVDMMSVCAIDEDDDDPVKTSSKKRKSASKATPKKAHLR
jgi:hypothetical protein